jgi:N,N'-diacetyllegionaminate synthase
MKKTVVIAEVGECYNGDMDTAKKLIDVSKNAGCDIVKFQTLDYENIDDSDPEKEWFYKIAFKPKGIVCLTEYARKIGIQILFTPENIKTAQWLLDAGHDSVKIASSSVGDKAFTSFINANFRTVFMSTGMAGLDEVFSMVLLLDKVDLWIMHCISEYPTGPLLEKNGLIALKNENVHLNMMMILKELFKDCKVGYSDHTNTVFVPVIAAAMGADVIEKHITLDRQTPINHYTKGLEYMGTDHVLSLEPDELKKMVHDIRELEKIRGEWQWKRTEGEIILKEFIRNRFR